MEASGEIHGAISEAIHVRLTLKKPEGIFEGILERFFVRFFQKYPCSDCGRFSEGLIGEIPGKISRRACEGIPGGRELRRDF